MSITKQIEETKFDGSKGFKVTCPKYLALNAFSTHMMLSNDVKKMSNLVVKWNKVVIAEKKMTDVQKKEWSLHTKYNDQRQVSILAEVFVGKDMEINMMTDYNELLALGHYTTLVLENSPELIMCLEVLTHDLKGELSKHNSTSRHTSGTSLTPYKPHFLYHPTPHILHKMRARNHLFTPNLKLRYSKDFPPRHGPADEGKLRGGMSANDGGGLVSGMGSPVAPPPSPDAPFFNGRNFSIADMKFNINCVLTPGENIVTGAPTA